MSKFLENVLVGSHKRAVQQSATQYEVDKYVASQRADIAKEQVKTVLRRPTVLAAIFGAGAVKEYKAGKKSEKTSAANSSTSLIQYVMLAAKFI